MEGHVDVVSLLLQFGADPNASDTVLLSLLRTKQKEKEIKRKERKNIKEERGGHI